MTEVDEVSPHRVYEANDGEPNFVKGFNSEKEAEDFLGSLYDSGSKGRYLIVSMIQES